VSERVNSEMFQLYHGENNFNKLIFNGMMMRSALFYSKPTHCWIFIVLAHWNNSLRVDMSRHSRHIILIPSIPVFALSLYCCVHSGKATNTILLSLLWPYWGSNPWSTAFEASTLMQLYKYKHKYVINIKLVVDFVCVSTLDLQTLHN
jgi:hypothetical protein